MQKEENDLLERTKTFALRVIRMYAELPKITESQILTSPSLRKFYRGELSGSIPSSQQSGVHRQMR